MTLDDRCRPIELILSDVDGVLTDGTLLLDDRGVETKRFSARDGLGIRLWQRAGHRFGLITSRNSRAVSLRADELGIEIVRQGTHGKLAAAREILDELKLAPRQVCYIGDDLIDLPLIREVGLGVAVADACEELRQLADHVTETRGGRGAVREIIQRILKAQNRWDEMIRIYTEPPKTEPPKTEPPK